MATYLIDTNVFIWWMRADARLKGAAKRAITDAESTLNVSLVTAWEIATKTAIGKLDGGALLLDAFDRLPREGAFTILAPTQNDIAALRALPLHHRDPFDRLLIAQAQAKDLPVITSDKAFKAYDVKVVW
jgi:PIN domain nuclease of toxin-antitoxin system